MALLTQIHDNILSAISGMTTASGYNYTWASTNQEDLNKVSSFPHVNIYLEPNEEEFEEQYYGLNTFRNWAKWRLESFNKIESEVSDSKWDSYYYQYSMLADIKRMIGNNPTLNGLVGGIIYRSSFPQEFGSSNDIYLPFKLITNFDTHYIEDRINP